MAYPAGNWHVNGSLHLGYNANISKHEGQVVSDQKELILDKPSGNNEMNKEKLLFAMLSVVNRNKLVHIEPHRTRFSV